MGLAGAEATGAMEMDSAEAETGSAAEEEDSAGGLAVALAAEARRPFLSRNRIVCFRRKTPPVSECRKCSPSVSGNREAATPQPRDLEESVHRRCRRST